MGEENEPLTGSPHMSYKSRGSEEEAIAGVVCKINTPRKLGEPLFNKVGGVAGVALKG